MKYTQWILMALLMISLAAAVDYERIEMKTSDVFVVQFQVTNINQFDYRNCVPYLDDVSDLKIKEYITFSPELFNLPPSASKIIEVRLEDVPPGYYIGALNVKCDHFSNGKLIDTRNILDPSDVPKYEILVTPEGVGQEYVFIPQQAYSFVSKSNQIESASFSIANTGSSSLSVDVIVNTADLGIISVSPKQAMIPADERQMFTITVKVPDNFNSMNTNFSIKLGDYAEVFPITGEKESITLGGSAVAQNLFQGTINAGGVKIPVFIVVIIIIVAGFFLLKPKKVKK